MAVSYPNIKKKCYCLSAITGPRAADTAGCPLHVHSRPALPLLQCARQDSSVRISGEAPSRSAVGLNLDQSVPIAELGVPSGRFRNSHVIYVWLEKALTGFEKVSLHKVTKVKHLLCFPGLIPSGCGSEQLLQSRGACGPGRMFMWESRRGKAPGWTTGIMALRPPKPLVLGEKKWLLSLSGSSQGFPSGGWRIVTNTAPAENDCQQAHRPWHPVGAGTT